MTLVEWEAISRDFVSLAYATVLRSLVLACLCGMAVWLLRSRTAELRYTLWRWTLLSLLALPLLLSITPALREAPRGPQASRNRRGLAGEQSFGAHESGKSNSRFTS